ncbi:MAG: hypothetical protein HYX41_07660, partial [Bdellovibrio sp.]|nr:hypothetical protein [Bdellovibrio sp.]
MQWISKLIVRYASWVVLLGSLLGLVGAIYSAALYLNLKTDILELLPTSSRSVLDLNRVTSRLESIDNLAVLVFSENTEASRRFVIDLADKLSKAPKDVIASVEFKIEKELAFFKSHQALYLELGDLISIRNYIRNRIDYEKELYNPLTIFGDRELSEPKLDFIALRRKYEGRTATFDQLPRGYYATRDEKIRAVLVNLPGKGIVAQKKLKATVESAIQELHPEKYHSSLKIK